jgi:adenine-specific DNA-methyltransferase
LKIENDSKILKEFSISINFGVKTGFNEAFIIDEKTKNHLIDKDVKNAEIIKPILKGRDLKKYSYEFANLWLVNSHNGVKTDKIPKIDIVNDYPSILEYFEGYRSQLENRSDKGEHWTNLRNCAYLGDLEKSKIIWGELSDKPKFALDESGEFYPEATLFFMVGKDLKYLLAILNSRLSEWYFNQITTTSGMGTNRWKKYKIELLPIKDIPESEQQPLITLVEEIIAIKKATPSVSTAEKEGEIDRLVYGLYGLTVEEINIIEQSIK